ncbi:MAG: DNA alkylation repair protein [Acidobacteria bacterium]|nr:DNA alkylation repair protein [Acidobacteriota bacterium]
MEIIEIENRLQSLANPEIAKHSQRYFKTKPGQYAEGDIFLGIRAPQLRLLAKEYKSLKINRVEELLKSKFHEQRTLALLILVLIFPRANEIDQQQIYDLYLSNTKFINNWDLVDCSAEHIVGRFLFNKDRSILYQLVKSNDLWERRISIISTFHFIRNKDFIDTLKISELLLKDTHDLIHKAVGWMLREVGKRDLKTEEAFLALHYKTMPRTMLRYAIEKFPEEIRQKYLKGKI